jgi:preprotein translocase subunit SecG
MSKLLKVIVNTLLLLAILSAGALVIPPFAGITTLVSDGMGNTNISRGAVTYAKKTDTSSVATGEKILVDDNSGKYIYTIQSLDTAAGTASVKNVISGDTTEITVRATVSKVIVTIPVIGFLSMAAQSREGIMIIGLAILFLVILFILSEVWKRDEEEDEEEEEEDEDEDDEKASEELRSRKKAALEEKKKREEQEMTEQLRAADQKTAEEEKQDEFEIPDLEEEEEETEQVSFNTVDLQNLVRGEETEEIPEAVEETEIVEEAAAEETAEEVTEETEETEETESAEPETVEEIEEFEETIEEPEEEPEPEPSEPIELAMPVYTAEELLQKAHAAGDDPKVIEDPATGITILDYSDIL